MILPAYQLEYTSTRLQVFQGHTANSWLWLMAQKGSTPVRSVTFSNLYEC